MNNTTATTDAAGTITNTSSSDSHKVMTAPPLRKSGKVDKQETGDSFASSSSSLSSSSSSNDEIQRRNSTGNSKTVNRHSRHLERIHHAKEVVKTRTYQVLLKTETTIETSVWCLPLKWCFHFPRHWPRTSSFVLGVVVPLWMLIACSTALGVILAGFESPPEIEGNDQILAARAQIQFASNVSALEVLDITNYCLDEYWVDQGVLGVFDGGPFSNTSNAAADEWAAVNRTDMEFAMDECTRSFTPQVLSLQSALANYSSVAFESLAFNWNRCWEYGGQTVFYPTKDMKVAARPDQQEAYFQQEWQQSQMDLFLTLRPENATAEQEREAFLASIEQATGEAACVTNNDGTAWFFFTIMTTVGYGNQAVVTDEGRLLIVTAGLASLILFGAVLGVCGYVLLAIFDDAVGRFTKSQFLQHPAVGMIVWGTIWLVFALAVATDVQLWWLERLPEYGATISRGDALWFAFISTSTIGLGDYFLQPEVIFASDTLKYSVLYMIGFVFLSTFFGKIAETLAYMLPQKHNSLESRLAATRVVACWPHGWLPIPYFGRRTESGGGVGGGTLGGPSDSPVDDATMLDSPDDQALLYRIDKLKELKPDPPVEEEGGGLENGGKSIRQLMDTFKGNPIHSLNVDLLQQEEKLLQEWMSVVQRQMQRAIARRQGQQQTIAEEDPAIAAGAGLTTIPEETTTSTTAMKTEEEQVVNASGNETTTSRPQPPTIVPTAEEEDSMTAVTPAEESFNPLARFFGSA